ncbi:MAG: IS66 family insertion sequence element accessory protein TnpB [Anaerolineales bacterium]
MIQLTPHMRIILAVEPADFRKGIDGLSQICRSVLQSDPFSGFLFVFMNKKRTAIKMLAYDGQGFWLFQKRLSKGRFHPNPPLELEQALPVVFLSHFVRLCRFLTAPGA